MYKETLSQTQLSNIMAAAGIIVLLASKLGYNESIDNVAFILSALWSLGWQIYSYVDRFKKGDVDKLGARK